MLGEAKPKIILMSSDALKKDALNLTKLNMIRPVEMIKYMQGIFSNRANKILPFNFPGRQ